MESLPAQEPLLKISDVANATGVAPALLRAWERRYGFPVTARTGGGQRLYTLVEVERIRRVRGLITQGLAISQAVAAVRCNGAPDPSLARVSPGQPVCPSIVDRLYHALLAFHGDEADVVARHVIAASGLATFTDDVLAPTMRRIGEDWAAGIIGIDQEHFAANWAATVLLQPARPPRGAPRERLLLACVESEQHCLGVHALNAVLTEAGYRVTMLGASVPTPALLASIRRTRPDGVMLSVKLPDNVRVVGEVVLGLRELAPDRRPSVGYGGCALADPRVVDGARWLGSSLTEALQAVPGWLRDAA